MSSRNNFKNSGSFAKVSVPVHIYNSLLFDNQLYNYYLQIALCYYDLKDALALDPDHAEAKQIMEEFKQEAESCHTSAVQLALQNRHRDALQKISSAIEYDPTHANYHNIRYVYTSHCV